MTSILSKEFRYTSAAGTDIRKTFTRIRREMEKQRAAGKTRTTAPQAGAHSSVTTLTKLTKLTKARAT